MQSHNARLSVDLAALGWTDADAASLAALGQTGLVAGRVTLEHTHIYTVHTATAEVLARVA